MGVEPTGAGITDAHTVLKTGKATGPRPPPGARRAAPGRPEFSMRPSGRRRSALRRCLQQVGSCAAGTQPGGTDDPCRYPAPALATSASTSSPYFSTRAGPKPLT